MAYNIPTQSTGDLIGATEWNRIGDAVDDIDARLGTGVTSGSSVTTQLAALNLSDSGKLAKASNLSDVANAATARTNLGVAYGTAAGTVAQGNDSRITVTQDATIGNSALGTRMTAVEGKLAAAPMQHAPGDSGTVAANNTANALTPTRSGGTSPVGVAFVAPASGRVKITWSCGITAFDTNSFALVGIQVATGGTLNAGTVVLAFSDSINCQNTGVTKENSYQGFYLVSGLTAGSTYNAILGYRNNGGAATYNRPKILVEPYTA